MNKNYYLIVLLSALCGALQANKRLINQAVAAHQVNYGQALQLKAADLGDLVVAQDKRDARRLQIRSLSQGSTGSDTSLRGSSCGYHALRNGTLFGQALIQNNRSAELLGQLRSASHAEKLCGAKQSQWRLDVLQQRFKSTARRVYRQLVLQGLTHAQGNQAEFDLLKSCIRDIDPSAVNSPEVWQNGFRYHADKAAVYRAISQRIKKKITQGTKASAQLKVLNSTAKFDKYFGAVSIDFTIKFDGTCISTLEPDVVLGRVTGDMYGKWIRTEEMPNLVDAQRSRSGILHAVPNMLVATYGEDLGGYEGDMFASENFAQLYTLIHHTKQDCVGVVLVYLGGSTTSQPSLVGKLFSWFGSWFTSSKKTSFADDARKVQGGQDNGHWIALVVSRLKGDLRYYVLDSLANSPRLRNNRINTIISILDGRKRLPGYAWTANQQSQQAEDCSYSRVTGGGSFRSPQASVHGAPSSGSSLTKMTVGAVGLGLLLYTMYNLRKKEPDPAEWVPMD